MCSHFYPPLARSCIWNLSELHTDAAKKQNRQIPAKFITKKSILKNFLELAQFNQGKLVAISNFHKAKKTGFVV